jgi:hypothetical protein
MAKIKVENTEITVVSVQNEDFISLTDMAHSQMQEHINKKIYGHSKDTTV